MTSPSLKPLSEGMVLNERYRILRAVGRGGMGIVYKAEHTRLQTTVAVKEIQNTQSNVAEYRSALQQCEIEARMLVRLNHPNLPKVSDAFVEKERFYLVMDFIEGATLEHRLAELRGKPINALLAVEWALQVADVLHYLHHQNPPIIFRDLKPSNIMVQKDGRIYLIDFGIARRFQPGATKDTSLLGSVGYSPPEQFGRQQTDPRSDIYAFGATFHQILTGQDPTANPFTFAPANLSNPKVPFPLVTLLSRCTSLDLAMRPASFQEIGEMLISIRDALAADPAYADVVREMEAQTQQLGNGAGTNSYRPGSQGFTARQGAGSGSREVGGSGRVEPPAPSQRVDTGDTASAKKSPLGVIALVVVALLLGGGAFAFLKGRETNASNDGSKTLPVSILTPPKPAPNGEKTELVRPPEVKEEVGAPPIQNNAIEFSKVEAQGVETDGQNGYFLKIYVAGKVKNRMGEKGGVAILFYDSKGERLVASDRSQNNPYVSPNGQLSVAQFLEVTSAEAPFETMLYIPLSQFPPESLSAPLKYRCAIFLEGKRISETDLKDIAIAISKIETPQPTEPTTPTPNDEKSAPPAENSAPSSDTSR